MALACSTSIGRTTRSASTRRSRSSQYQPNLGFDRHELAIDVYYRFQITPAIYLQPEAQHIIKPSGSRSIEDPLVLGLRAGLTF